MDVCAGFARIAQAEIFCCELTISSIRVGTIKNRLSARIKEKKYENAITIVGINRIYGFFGLGRMPRG
jgi:hypothetical protein